MRVTQITPDRRAEWNAFVGKHPFFVLLQSWEWGEFKEKAGWSVFRVAVEKQGRIMAGAQVLIKPAPLGLASIAYVPRGPLLNWEDKPVWQALLSALHTITRRHRAILLKIEPATPYSPELQHQLQAYDFRPSDFNNHPRCSMLIDLTPDLDTILAKMGKTTRYNINYSSRQGVEVREATEADLGIYYRLMAYNAEKAGVPARLESHYRQEWAALAPKGMLKIFLATYKDEVLAMRVPAVFGNIAATFYSGFYKTYKKLKPSELLMWECMKWAKSQGCTIYDVWGIPDEVGEHMTQGKPLPQKQEGGLWGVYHFKRGFGGNVVYYIGTYDYVYSKPLYWSMNTAISRLGSLDKLGRLMDRLKF